MTGLKNKQLDLNETLGKEYLEIEKLLNAIPDDVNLKTETKYKDTYDKIKKFYDLKNILIGILALDNLKISTVMLTV